MKDSYSEIVWIILQTIATTIVFLYIMFCVIVLKFHAHGSFFAPGIYIMYKQYNHTSWAFKQNYTIYFLFFFCLLSCYYPFYE